MSKKKHKVFVYGTLRENREATHVLEGYTLHLVGQTNFPFPSVKEQYGDLSGEVFGNLIEVDDKELEELDRYENVAGGLYERREVEVYPIESTATSITAFVYVGTNQIFPPEIKSGDWFDR